MTRVEVAERTKQSSEPLSPVGEAGWALFWVLYLSALSFGALLLCQWLLNKGIGWQIAAVFLFLDCGLIYAASYLWGVVVGRAKHSDESTAFNIKVFETALALGFATVGFAVLTAVLIRHKWLLTATGVRPHDLTYDAANTYIWNLVAAIPVLDLTGAFNWQRHLQLTNEAGRLLLLAYKLALVIPVLTVVGIVTWERPSGNGHNGPAARPNVEATVREPTASAEHQGLTRQDLS